jgi:hypothetical protein
VSEKKIVGSLFENVGEFTGTCLITTVLGIGLSHWIIASLTGLAAGVPASVALLPAETQNRLAISAI